MNTLFFRCIAADNKADELLSLVQLLRRGEEHPNARRLELDLLRAIPGSPFAYWADEALLEAFQSHSSFEANERTAKHGAATLDDYRFLRCWWEVSETRIRDGAHVPFAKGGNATPFFVRIPLTINWQRNGAEVKAYVAAKVGSASRTIQAEGYYFRPGVTWPLRASRFSPQALPQGCVFSLRSSSAFVPAGELVRTLAVMSSSTVDALLKLSLGRVGHPEFTVGVIQRLPWPTSERLDGSMQRLGRAAWLVARRLYNVDETSHAFLLPLDLNERITGTTRDELEAKLGAIQDEIDETAFNMYAIGPDSRAVLAAAPKREVGSGDAEAESEEGVEGVDDLVLNAVSEVVTSHLVGVSFARFDPRLATGERAIPPEPEPFDPLPARSPGMYPDGEEPAGRPDILVDDEGHPDDLAARARAIAERMKIDAREDLRAWLAKEFFPLHIKMYSKSRRKAPIYWQLATPSASYSVWLYLHAFSSDTLFRVQHDYVAPKLAQEERRVESLTSELPDGTTVAQRKQLAAQEGLVEELRAFLEEVKRVAPLWRPNLDDGVIINFAPLWRLVPHHKPWQKELKETWDALCEGKYDWAHLAMHLWPERVVPKCAKDRSFAIAHGLEEVLWIEGEGGKWTARKTPTRPLAELIDERSSPAVKSALKGLLEAPVASKTAKMTKRGKANA